MADIDWVKAADPIALRDNTLDKEDAVLSIAYSEQSSQRGDSTHG